MSKNSLSTLLGNYMSDSENDDNNDREQHTTNSFSKDVDNLLNEIESPTTNIKETPPVTNWTKCMDPNTGHPYYWNISTKEVTWEKPLEYEKYLQEIKKFSNKLPDNCWIIGYSDGSTTPYYVNEYTREVSWVKPVNFKEKILEEKTKKSKCTSSSQAMKNLKKSKKVRKKALLPEKLGTGSDEDLKIELISSYSGPQTESSSDDEKINKEKNVQNNLEKSSIKLKLVAAYATDDESDTELNDTNSISNKAIIPIKENSQQTIDSVIDNEKCSTPTNINNISSSSPNNLNISPPLSPEKKPLKSFASIITGDKPENLFDDEINKLKEELEKDLINAIEQQQENDDNELTGGNKCTDNKNIENSFDEKTFQRKRRIEFKTNKKIDNNIERDNNDKENNKKKHLYSNFQRSHTEFLNKNDDENSSGGVLEIIKNDINVGITDEKDILKKNCKDLSDIISGKVKFLSVGHFEVSPVQAMNIQLETLLAAFRSSALDFDYFFKWLQQTSNDLLKLEENVAPNGWKCKWDRQTSQYCYVNLETDEIQWEFPKTTDISEEDSKTITEVSKAESIKTNGDDKDDNNGKNEQQLIDQINVTTQLLMVDRNRGEDEMDISTTPPPNEHEQIILGQHWDADNAPPPPIISTPSPPPPPNYDSQSTFLSTELASFYSDIATLDPTVQNPNIDNNNASNLISSSGSIVTSNKKRLNDAGTIESTTIQKKKRKKVKVQGLGMKDNEMSCMVAKWQKAQKELN